MNSEGHILLPSYIFWNLKEYKNSVLSRKYLIRYGEQKIIEECEARGYHVKLNIISHEDFSVVRKHGDKSGEYPHNNSYVLEIV